MSIKSYRTYLLVGYVLLIFAVTSIPGSSLQNITILATNDKIVHFVEYAILGYLFINALEPAYRNRKGFAISTIFLFLIPLLDESVQNFIPGRYPDFMDGVVDVIGGFIGALIRIKR